MIVDPFEIVGESVQGIGGGPVKNTFQFFGSDVSIPAVGNIGLVVMVVLLFTAGALIVMRRCLPTDRPVKTR